MSTCTIQQNLQRVHQQIRQAAHNCKRDINKITLLAVSKTKPVQAIEAAIIAGQRTFGENYIQEGVEKVRWFSQRPQGAGLSWHFIGRVQSNKSRLIAEYFDWCHSLDSPKLAQRLNEQRPIKLAPLNVLIQINISGEDSKSGILPYQDELLTIATKIVAYPRLRLRGLMSIPAPETDFQRQLAVFNRIAMLFEQLKTIHPSADTLSLGMTGDMAAAITVGSTLLRVGTAIFGARKYATVAQ